MKGNNSIELCKASMIEIVQEWIDKKIRDETLEVTDVTSTKVSPTEVFTVELATKESKDAQ
jgi:hypothetical protein